MRRPRVEPATCWLQVQRPFHYTTPSHETGWRLALTLLGKEQRCAVPRHHVRTWKNCRKTAEVGSWDMEGDVTCVGQSKDSFVTWDRDASRLSWDSFYVWILVQGHDTKTKSSTLWSSHQDWLRKLTVSVTFIVETLVKWQPGFSVT